MSIYATWLHLDPHGEHEDSCERWVPTSEDDARARGAYAIFTAGPVDVYAVYDSARPCSCGQLGPLVYHGSHVNPSQDGERGGRLEVGAIPNHCHPSVRSSLTDDGPPVEFLRLSLDEDPSTYQGAVPGSATVVLDRSDVERLRDVLTAWLDSDDRA